MFDPTKIPQYLSLLAKIREVWDEIPPDAQSRLDMVVREAVKILPLPDNLDNVKGLLAAGEGPLPARVIGAAMDPTARGWFMGAQSVYPTDDIIPETGVVKCRQCGAMQDIQLHP